MAIGVVPQAARRGTRGAPAPAAPPLRGCTAGPPRPDPDGTAGRTAPGTFPLAVPARRRGSQRRAGPQACPASPPPPARWVRRRRPRPAPAPSPARRLARGSGRLTGPAVSALSSSPSPGPAPTRRGPQTYSNTGGIPPPPLGLMEGIASPSSTSAKVAAATRRFAAHPARMTESTAEAGASRPRRENSSCWLSGSGSPVDDAGPGPSAKPRRVSGSAGFRAPGRCVTSKRKSSISSSQRTHILFRCRFVFSHVIA